MKHSNALISIGDRYKKYFFIVVIYVFISTFILHAQSQHKSHVLIIEGWMELDDPESKFTIQDPSADIKKIQMRQASENVALLTSEILAGMIYGYSFAYTPKSSIRNVKEQWELTSVGKIFPHDPNLSVVNASIYDASLHVVSRYNLTKAQIRRSESWDTASVHTVQGQGEVFITDSLVASKVESLHDAIRDAVLKQLKREAPNRPENVIGTIRLTDNPIFYRSGQLYSTKVMVDIAISDIQSYEIF